MKKRRIYVFAITLSLVLTVYLLFYLFSDYYGTSLKEKLNGFFLLLLTFTLSAILGMIFIFLDPPQENKKKKTPRA